MCVCMLNGAAFLLVLVSIINLVFVSVSVCYRSSGRYAYSTGPTKVPKESARHKD